MAGNPRSFRYRHNISEPAPISIVKRNDHIEPIAAQLAGKPVFRLTTLVWRLKKSQICPKLPNVFGTNIMEC